MNNNGYSIIEFLLIFIHITYLWYLLHWFHREIPRGKKKTSVKYMGCHIIFVMLVWEFESVNHKVKILNLACIYICIYIHVCMHDMHISMHMHISICRAAFSKIAAQNVWNFARTNKGQARREKSFTVCQWRNFFKELPPPLSSSGRGGSLGVMN